MGSHQKQIYEKSLQKKERQFEKEKHIKIEKAETMRKIIYMLKDDISFIKCEKCFKGNKRGKMEIKNMTVEILKNSVKGC